jgi:hypothetical protein
MTIRDWMLVLLANSIMLLGGIVLYDTLRDGGKPTFGVVDLATVYREKEEAFAKILGSDASSEEDRNKAVGGGAGLRQGAAGRAGEASRKSVGASS